MNLHFSQLRSFAFGMFGFFYALASLVLASWGLPSWGLVSLILLVLLVWLCIYLVYFNEGYVLYFSVLFGFFISSFILIASWLPAFSLLRGATGGYALRGVLVAVPIFSVSFLVLYIFKDKPKQMLYEISDKRVQVLRFMERRKMSAVSQGFWAGVSGWVGSLGAKYLQGPVMEALVVCLFTLVLLYMVWLSRDNLRGLRAIANKGRDLKVTYTFYWIEEIRAARRDSYVIRIAGWFR